MPETKSSDVNVVWEERYCLDSWNDRSVVIDQDGYLMAEERDSSMQNAEAAVFTIEVMEDGIEEAVKLASIAERAIVMIGSKQQRGDRQKVPAILCSASGSQELGNGIGAVLSGKVNPAGQLPMTWYRWEANLPESFVPEIGNYEPQIRMHGKIKIAEICFIIHSLS